MPSKTIELNDIIFHVIYTVEPPEEETCFKGEIDIESVTTDANLLDIDIDLVFNQIKESL